MWHYRAIVMAALVLDGCRDGNRIDGAGHRACSEYERRRAPGVELRSLMWAPGSSARPKPTNPALPPSSCTPPPAAASRVIAVSPAFGLGEWIYQPTRSALRTGARPGSAALRQPGESRDQRHYGTYGAMLSGADGNAVVRLRAGYLTYTGAEIDYYTQLHQKGFGREIPPRHAPSRQPAECRFDGRHTSAV